MFGHKSNPPQKFERDQSQCLCSDIPLYEGYYKDFFISIIFFKKWAGTFINPSLGFAFAQEAATGNTAQGPKFNGNV